MKFILTLSAIAICGAFTLNAADQSKKGPGGDQPKLTPEEAFVKLDKNKDGFLSKDEFLASPRAQKDPAKAKENFKKFDANSDGKISKEEFITAANQNPGEAPSKTGTGKK